MSFRQRILLITSLVMVCAPMCAWSQSPEQASAKVNERRAAVPARFQGETSKDYNRRLLELSRGETQAAKESSAEDYRIGTEDLLDISVFEAPELNRTVRVSASGEISLPLIGALQAAGLTASDLEAVLREHLKQTYMKDPHVSVFVREMQSHAVSVFGAVEKPGVYQIRDSKTVVEVLSMAEGLADDAGDKVIVVRGTDDPGIGDSAGSNPSEPRTISIDLKDILQSGDPRYNVMVYPGDIVKVPKAGIVYVVGEVKKPGGFLLKTNENISVLQALALAEGLTNTSAKSRARIIHTNEGTGKRTEIPIDLQKVLTGKAPDPILHANDIVFVPNSTGKSAFYKGAEAAVSIVGGVIIYRR